MPGNSCIAAVNFQFGPAGASRLEAYRQDDAPDGGNKADSVFS